MRNYAYLKMIDIRNNNYKFYEIIENDDNSVDVNYGRVGALNPAHKHYDKWERNFYDLLREKERKGYVRDDTHKQNTTANKQIISDYEPIEYKPVRDVVEEFLKKQRQFVAQNYSVKIEHVTEKQIDDAKFYLNELRIARNRQYDNEKQNLTDSFNSILYKEDAWSGKALPECLLFCVERKLRNVEDSLLQGIDRFGLKLSATEWKAVIKEMDRIIEREENLINALEGEYNQYKLNHPEKNDKPKFQGTVLSANGLKMEEITYKEEDTIMNLLRKENWQGMENLSRYNSAYKVVVDKTQKKYDDYCKKNNIKDTMLLWHGSLTENMWSIMSTGLRIMPNASNGRAFGNGLYFANNSQKSANYTSAKPNTNKKGDKSANWNHGGDTHGYLALFEVATGKPQIVYSSGHYNKTAGYDSLWYKAQGGNWFKDDEIVIYDDSACTLKYMVKIDSDRHERHYNLNPSSARLDNGLTELVKDKNGIYGNLDITELSDKSRDYWGHKFNTTSADNIKIYEDKILINDKPVLNYQDGKSITSDDFKWLFREVKKNFFEKESEFEEFKSGKEQIITKDSFEKEDLEDEYERA